MKKRSIAAILSCFSVLGMAAGGVKYTGDAKMILPKDYRQWVFLSSGIGMSYSASVAPNPNPNFENVFVNPQAYLGFVKTGVWPDKTVMILESRASDSRVSINKNGRVQTEVTAIEAHVKDASHGGWAFYSFGNGTQQEGSLFPRTAACYSCHKESGAVDTTFVQFYPTLIEIAKAKGTYEETPEADAPVR